MSTHPSTYAVTGMTCEHCVRAVTEEVGEVPGVTGVDVELVGDGTSTVTVRSEDESVVDDDAVRAAIAEAGYTVVAGVGPKDGSAL